ncbi:hypothetical protein AAFC00_000363 [Neodothiora populina]|uniref:Uncharacterized protein n=1 Tax=Neodothiora populina TaxID=2781224 RepID=A0ABR3PCP6_9PEZI
MTTITDLSDWEKDPRLFLFTSLTAGSSHIITATSRMETILKANRLPFQAIDTATDEKARKLWGRRAAKRKLPGLVKDGFVIADLEEVEEWNEFGELKENIGPVPAADANVHAVQTTLGSLRMHDAISTAANNSPTPAPLFALKSTPIPANTPAPTSRSSEDAQSKPGERIATPLAAIAQAKKDADNKSLAQSSTSAASVKSSASVIDQAPKPETINSSIDDKKESIELAKEAEEHTDAKATAPSTSAASSDPAAAAASTETTDEPAESAEATKPSIDDKTKVVNDADEKKSEVAEKATEPETDNTPTDDEKASTKATTATEEKPASLSSSTVKDAPTPSMTFSSPVGSNSTTTAAAASTTGEKKHRGSSVSAASPEEIRDAEEKNLIREEGEDESR